MKYLLLIILCMTVNYCEAYEVDRSKDKCDMELYTQLRLRLELGDRFVVRELLNLEGMCNFKVQFSPELVEVLAEDSDLNSQYRMGWSSQSWDKNGVELDERSLTYIKWLELAAFRGELNAQHYYAIHSLDFQKNSDIAYSVCWLASSLIQGQRESLERLRKLAVVNGLQDLVKLLNILEIEFNKNLNLVTMTSRYNGSIEAIREDRHKASLDHILWEANMKREGRDDLIQAERALVEKIKLVKENPSRKIEYVGKCELDTRFPDTFLQLLKLIKIK